MLLLQRVCCYCRVNAAYAVHASTAAAMKPYTVSGAPTTVNTAILQLRPNKNNNNFNLLLTGYMEASKKKLLEASLYSPSAIPFCLCVINIAGNECMYVCMI